jgi:hypothetical protein
LPQHEVDKQYVEKLFYYLLVNILQHFEVQAQDSDKLVIDKHSLFPFLQQCLMQFRIVHYVNEHSLVSVKVLQQLFHVHVERQDEVNFLWHY